MIKTCIKVVVFGLMNVLVRENKEVFYSYLLAHAKRCCNFCEIDRVIGGYFNSLNRGEISGFEFYEFIKKELSLDYINFNQFIHFMTHHIKLESHAVYLLDSIKPESDVKVFLFSDMNEIYWSRISSLGLLSGPLLTGERQIFSYRLRCEKRSRKMQNFALNIMGVSLGEILYIDNDYDLVSSFSGMGGNGLYYDIRNGASLSLLKKKMIPFGVFE